MPLKLTWFERQIFLHRNWGPGPILDAFSPLAFKAVYAAKKLDVFDVLESTGPLDVQELANRIKADASFLRVLLDVLCSIGYLEKNKASRYANSAMTRIWMVSKAENDCSGMLGYFDDAFDRWSSLDQTIRDGKPVEIGSAWFDRHPGSWDRYHENLRAVAGLIAGEMVKRAKLPDHARRLIDIGGSHGLYSVRFCQRYPELKATILDWKQARPIAEKTIAAHGLQDRITFTEGDAVTGDIGNTYDVALLFNFIRVLAPPEAIAVLKKTRNALNKNGIILVADQFCTSMPTPFAKMNALLIVLELLNATPGKPYSASEAKQMLVEAGFVNPREISLRRSPGISIIAANRVA
jgi:hypothetical protein